MEFKRNEKERSKGKLTGKKGIEKPKVEEERIF